MSRSARDGSFKPVGYSRQRWRDADHLAEQRRADERLHAAEQQKHGKKPRVVARQLGVRQP